MGKDKLMRYRDSRDRRRALGRVLMEDFLRPKKISINRLSKDCRIPLNNLFDLIEGRRVIDEDEAKRLAKTLGTTPHFWMNLEADKFYEKWVPIETPAEPEIFSAMTTTLITDAD